MPNPIQGPQGGSPIDPNIGKEWSQGDEGEQLSLSETGGSPVSCDDVKKNCENLKSTGQLPGSLQKIVDAVVENGRLPIGPFVSSARNPEDVIAAIIASTGNQD